MSIGNSKVRENVNKKNILNHKFHCTYILGIDKIHFTTHSVLPGSKPDSTEESALEALLTLKSWTRGTSFPLVLAGSVRGSPAQGRGGLVARSRPWGRSAPGPKPDSTEDPPCMGPAAR
ncbi:hypothetical protein AVEN_147040-1 [Araneus ventricosus]|uniref:Uncharacterized protein n=1 Tax=Araneus ventricosus TaxID=182803 RepID=A0A4Y2VML8_ARAVE|nr:hypothetical protein AVEN_147040-1 [Araneus ventricosus]